MIYTGNLNQSLFCFVPGSGSGGGGGGGRWYFIRYS